MYISRQNIENYRSHNGSNSQQRINNNRTTTLERTAATATGGLTAFYCYQIFALDSLLLSHKNIKVTFDLLILEIMFLFFKNTVKIK